MEKTTKDLIQKVPGGAWSKILENESLLMENCQGQLLRRWTRAGRTSELWDWNAPHQSTCQKIQTQTSVHVVWLYLFMYGMWLAGGCPVWVGNSNTSQLSIVLVSLRRVWFASLTLGLCTDRVSSTNFVKRRRAEIDWSEIYFMCAVFA